MKIDETKYKNDFGIEPEDREKLKAALDQALHSDWGTKPREQAQKFDWSHAAEQYSALFEQLTARSGS